jgi:hypothetical protein
MEKEKQEEAHNFQKDSQLSSIWSSFFSIKSILLIFTLTLLIFLGVSATKSTNNYLKLTKDISKLYNAEQLFHSKIDKFLENITAGIYDHHSKKQENIKILKLQAQDEQKKADIYLYYFFGTIILFIIIFILIDRDLLIFFIALCALISLYFGLTAPLLMVIVHKTLPLVGLATLSFETKTIMSTIGKLFLDKNYLIAALVVLFSIAIPLLKTILILTYGFLKESGAYTNIIQKVDKLGKWSMADVFIVAFLVVIFSSKQDIDSSLKIEAGLYFFIAYVLLSMIGSSMIGKK